MLEFSGKSLCTDSRLVSFVAHHRLLSAQMNASFACNVLIKYCSHFNLQAYIFQLIMLYSSPLTSTRPHLNSDVGLEEGEY